MTLAREKCVACRRDSPRVTDEEIAELQPLVTEWRLAEDGGIKRLDRTFMVTGFAEAMSFADKVGEAAEEEVYRRYLQEYDTRRASDSDVRP